MIKTGQIYKGKVMNMRFVVTRGQRYYTSSCYVISNDGRGYLKPKRDIENLELIAEYPTWQEAVNSKEFRND